MLLSTILIWAFNVTVTKYVLTHGFRPLAYASIRYGLAALLFAALTFAVEGTLRVGGGRSLALLGAASVFLLGNQFAFVYALKLSSATTVSLIMGTTPIFTALVSFALRIERLSAGFWLAVAITFGGVALVAFGSGGDLSGSLGGDLCALALSASWGVYSVTIAPLMRTYSPYRISAIVLLAMGVPLVAAASPQLGAQDYGMLGWVVWLSLAFAVVGPLVLTNVLWFTAIHRVGAARATLFANLQPFVAAVFALVILSEHMSALQVVGGVGILAGILLERRWAAVEAPLVE
jgi:drug/metabolite transporter (DMT)-like permease